MRKLFIVEVVCEGMSFRDALSEDDQGILLHVHVVPHSKEYLIEYDKWRKELKIKVKAPPKEGKANQDLIRFLSHYFKNPVLISGDTSRSKRVKVENTLEETAHILGKILWKRS